VAREGARRVAAVQMQAALGDVGANLQIADEQVRRAVREGGAADGQRDPRVPA
jgi:predicted amidohydrolase